MTRNLVIALVTTCLTAATSPVKDDVWHPVSTVRVQGLLGERLRLWREIRLWRVIGDPFILEGFETPPGKHAWQGEHVGKWLHAATLAYEATHDEKLLRSLQDTAKRLIGTQQANGYIGTYEPAKTFFAPPGAHTKGSWDVWTARYVLYGLLVYDRYHPDPAAVKACVRLGDLLAETFGPNGRNLTETGTRHGMSSTTLLESVMMLYERTGERRFLDFAGHLHRTIEANRELRIVSAAVGGEDMSIPGDGKAYQLMANLLGFGEMYRHTGNAEFLKANKQAWANIRDQHLFETGGPWGYKSDNVKNVECFAAPRYYHPDNLVENCTTTTWIQLSLQLLRQTGDARYGVEAERAALNHLIGSQSPNGTDWSYYTAPNCRKRAYNNELHCCGSSGPRALEMYARHLVGAAGGALSLNSYLPMTAKLAAPGIAATGLAIEGDYPFGDHATLRLSLDRPSTFAVDFRLPAGSRGLSVAIDGKRQILKPQPSGFLRLSRLWKPNESVEVKFDSPLEAHFHSDREGKRWVAFTRGPLVFAQDGGNRPELSVGKEDSDGRRWLDPGPGTSLRLKGTATVLVPYYQAGATGASVHTYIAVHGRD